MYLFPDFLKDPKEYEKAEKLWLQAWSVLIKHLGQQKNWKVPWFENKFGNGEPCLDGNPIFSALDRRRRIVVRVLQVPPDSEREGDFTYWTDKFAKGDPEELDELVIACVLSDETLAQATDLMTKWALKEPLDGSVRKAKAHRTPRTPMPRRHGMPRA
jgi:hypothetical protein